MAKKRNLPFDYNVCIKTDNAEKWVTQYNCIIEQVQKRLVILKNQLSVLDQKREDILHYIEGVNCNAVTLAKLTKALKVVQRQRREVKSEMAACHSILSSCGKSHYKGKKTYTPKTSILKDVLGDY